MERALDLTNNGPVVLLTDYQTPAAIHRSGLTRIEAWLRNRRVRGAADLAKTVVAAAEEQLTALPGEKLAATMEVCLAKGGNGPR
ncbi:hypothetical protein [Nocardia rhizosphaerae]|uniref:Uncharacterized protein n=1 Tax=Nocardia rhizosphaerae TaxID=1691571 RepID=A0ABV8LCM9_9NOCA